MHTFLPTCSRCRYRYTIYLTYTCTDRYLPEKVCIYVSLARAIETRYTSASLFALMARVWGWGSNVLPRHPYAYYFLRAPSSAHYRHCPQAHCPPLPPSDASSAPQPGDAARELKRLINIWNKDQSLFEGVCSKDIRLVTMVHVHYSLSLSLASAVFLFLRRELWIVQRLEESGSAHCRIQGVAKLSHKKE